MRLRALLQRRPGRVAALAALALMLGSAAAPVTRDGAAALARLDEAFPAVGYAMRDDLRPQPTATPAPKPPPIVLRAPAPAPPPRPAAAAPPATAPPAPPRAPAVVSGVSPAAVIALINQDRAAAGLPALAVSGSLCRAAANHAAQDAAEGVLTHNGYVQDVDAQGLAWQALGEILASWSAGPSAGAVNSMWMNSPDHRAIILSGTYTSVGAGWAMTAGGVWYVSAIFMR